MQAIKTKDTKGNIKHYNKKQTNNTKRKDVDKKENATVKSNQQVRNLLLNQAMIFSHN